MLYANPQDSVACPVGKCILRRKSQFRHFLELNQAPARLIHIGVFIAPLTVYRYTF